jgi:hypothetical protein
MSAVAFPMESLRAAVQRRDEEAILVAAERLYETDLREARAFWRWCLAYDWPYVYRLPAFFLSRRFSPRDTRRISRPDHAILLETLDHASRTGDPSATISSLNALSGFIARVDPPEHELDAIGSALASYRPQLITPEAAWPLVEEAIGSVLWQLTDRKMLRRTLTDQQLHDLAAAGVDAAIGIQSVENH